MAQVYGFLRSDKATYGEKAIFRLLRDNLPKEFSLYVECPLPGKRVHRYPDFIVVTNYGVVILEVKDWIQIVRADRYGAEIRTRGNEVRKEANPVNQARNSAILLADELHSIKNVFNDKDQEEIPWGYAVVFPNLPTSTITQLRHVWGEEFVLNKDDLDSPLILSRLKVTLPKDRVRTLKKQELDFIRATINPTVLFEPEGKPAIILDGDQEQIVSEPVRAEIIPPISPKSEFHQAMLIEEISLPEAMSEPSVQLGYEERISNNASIRLVRGVAGSGKTLVLTQRAKYLAAQYPEWNIAVLTFNDPLKQHFDAIFKGARKVKPLTFHSLCSLLLRGYLPWKEPSDPSGWLENHKDEYPVLGDLGVSFVADEIKWIKEMGIKTREEYLEIDRKGRGQQGRLFKLQRSQVYDALLGYQAYLDETGIPDWTDLPYLALQGLDDGKIEPPCFDAILVDEAQDFAPVWIKLITRVLNPEGGVLFLTDDPAQSIYRYYSWKEKGVHVTGRTRWLKIPYRNTYEIYQAAYQLINSDPKLQKSLEEEGLLVAPNLASESMRHGEKPLIQRYSSFDDEILGLRGRIEYLLQHGYDSRQIAVLHRRTSGVRRLQAALKGCDVSINTFHAYKGLEFDVVFLCQLHETDLQSDSEDEESAERRLVYMAMTRARQLLYMGFEGKLPHRYQSMNEYVDLY